MPVKIQGTMSSAASALQPQGGGDFFFFILSHFSEFAANLAQPSSCLLRTGVAGGEKRGCCRLGGGGSRGAARRPCLLPACPARPPREASRQKKHYLARLRTEGGGFCVFLVFFFCLFESPGGPARGEPSSRVGFRRARASERGEERRSFHTTESSVAMRHGEVGLLHRQLVQLGQLEGREKKKKQTKKREKNKKKSCC